MNKQKDTELEEPVIVLPIDLENEYENEYDTDEDIDEPIKFEEEPDFLPLYEIVRDFNLQTGIPIGDKITLFKLSEFLESM